MFCKNCGTQLNDNAVICPQCGVPTSNPPPIMPQQVQAKRDNPLAIVGFVLAFFCSIAGLICSIVGYNKAKNEGLDNRGLALAGIIISAVSIGATVLVVAIWFFWFFLFIWSIENTWQVLLPFCL